VSVLRPGMVIHALQCGHACSSHAVSKRTHRTPVRVDELENSSLFVVRSQVTHDLLLEKRMGGYIASLMKES